VSDLDRRDFLQLVGCALAVPGGRRFFNTWLAAAPNAYQHTTGWQPAEPPLLRNYTPAFFSRDDFAALEAFTEILIPRDDTPGARDAHCAHFIDFVLQASTETAPGVQRQWREAMRALRDAGFHTATATERLALVDAMSRPEREKGASHPAYSAYRLIKQQNTFAFYTSRAGSIEALDYKGNSFNAAFPACEHEEHTRL
jgi:hypothetical protein